VSKQRSTILFVCVHNAGRSQMAAGLARNLGGEGVEVRSAGSDPAERVNPAAVAAMAEVDVDLQDAAPKLLETDAVREADVIVTMGCGDACPVFPGKRYEDWDLEDPAGKDLAQVRQIRDEIRSRVEALLESLGAS
jgi:protein-tyrosine-phosphatase